METLAVTTYVIYGIYVALLTIFVAKILFKNSLAFMLRIFENKIELAKATNSLFEVGFFLFGFGIGLWYLTIYEKINNLRELIEVLSVKVGAFTLFMGILLFLNLFMFFRGLKSKTRKEVGTVA